MTALQTPPRLRPVQREDFHVEAGPFVASGVVSVDALCVIDTLARRWAEPNPRVLLALALVVEAQLRGHAGLTLPDAPRILLERRDVEGDEDGVEAPASPWPPDLAAWEAEALASSMIAADGPFCATELGEGRRLVQSRRMAWEETQVAQALVDLASGPPTGPNALLLSPAEVDAACLRLLGSDGLGTPAERAFRAVAARRLALVTGGPGTGKTWSIKRVLAMLLEVAAQRGYALRVVLAAPTGKAGVRMREAIGEDIETLNTPEDTRRALQALPSSTVHKLLRIQPGSGASRFGPEAPLPADVVVLDEASMVDLTLMRRLLAALGPATRLIMLGDRDQLPSVDVGSVLSDIVRRPLAALGDPTLQGGPLAPCVARFDRNHRSGDAPALAELVSTLQAPDTATARARVMALLTGAPPAQTDSLPGRIVHLGPAENGRPTREHITALMAPWYADTLDGLPPDGYLSVLATLLRDGGRKALAENAGDLLRAYDRYRILAVHRRGPLGVAGLTWTVAKGFKQAVFEADIARRVKDEPRAAEISAARRRDGLLTQSGLWLGQPVLVTENAYDVNLWNGDIGLVLPSLGDTRQLEAVFPSTEARTDPTAPPPLRRVALSRLPPHADAFVLTVHKSQGSQFNHVALVLADRASQIQTRELVYTGFTRASQRLTWLGRPELLEAALGTRVVRASGLGWRIG